MLNKIKFSLLSATVVIGLTAGHNQLSVSSYSMEDKMIARAKTLPPRDNGCHRGVFIPTKDCSKKKIVKIGGGTGKNA